MHLPVSILGLCGALAMGGDVIRVADIASAECSLVLVGPFTFRELFQGYQQEPTRPFLKKVDSSRGDRRLGRSEY
jgi:hypothetical protein